MSQIKAEADFYVKAVQKHLNEARIPRLDRSSKAQRGGSRAGRVQIPALPGSFAGGEMLRKLALTAVVFVWGVTAADTPAAWNNLGAERFRAGDMAGAEQLYLRALAGWDQAGEPRLRVRTMSNLAVVYRAQGRSGDAEATYMEALRLLEKTGSEESAEAATTLNNLAELYRIRGEAARGKRYAQQAVELAERLYGAGHPAASAGLHTLAAIEREQGHMDQALALYDRERAALERAPGARTDPRLVTNLANVAEIRLAGSEWTEAESAARRALDVAETSLGPRDPARAQCLNNLAQALRFERRFEEAEPLYRAALDVPAEAAAHARILANYAGFYHDQERESRAVELYTQALAALETSLGARNPEVALVHTRLAEVRRAQGHYARSLELYHHAVPVLEHSWGFDDPRVMAASRALKRTEAEASRHIVAAR
jgi:tetratricopeptide (TPR) repeat protein